MSVFEVIRASHADLEKAAQLRYEMGLEMGEDWDAKYPGWRHRYVEYFSARQDAGESCVFLAKVGDTIAGMVTVSIVQDYHSFVRHKMSGRVNAVFVIPSLRRKGIGKAMMDSGIQWVKDKGCVGVRLNSSENAVPLYSSMGFKARREMELIF